MDINIRGLRVYSHIGVFEEEKRDGQEFLVDITCTLNDEYSYDTDELNRTVNYGGVCDMVIDYIESVRCDLIETAAEEIATMLLQSYDIIDEVTVEIHKPNAPVDADFEDISCVCHKRWEKVYLSLGSNMGDRDSYLDYAIDDIKVLEKVRNVKTSSIYTTEPYGREDLDEFRNLVCELETFYTPMELLDVCLDIEVAHDRVREEKWGPRTIDIDIILFGDKIINTSVLTIPHIDMHNREFVLEPLCEIARNAYHPLYNKRAYELLEDLCGR